MPDSLRRFGHRAGGISLRRVVSCERKAERNENRPHKPGESVQGPALPVSGLAACSVVSRRCAKRPLPQGEGSFEPIAVTTPPPLAGGGWGVGALSRG